MLYKLELLDTHESAHPPLHDANDINSTQSADATVNAEVSSTSSTDANTNANVKFLRMRILVPSLIRTVLRKGM